MTPSPPLRGRLDGVNRAAALVDVAVCIFLCVVAVRGIETLAFESLAVGLIQCAAAAGVGLSALIRVPILDKEMHLAYTFAGRGCIFVLFGTMGLSATGDPARYVFSAVTVGVGLVYLLYGCVARQSPMPCIDCGEYGAAATPPPPTPVMAAAATPLLSHPFSESGRGKTATYGGTANPWEGAPGSSAAPAAANPFREGTPVVAAAPPAGTP